MLCLRVVGGLCMAGFIEGVSRDQTTLFPERLDDWIGEDHLARVVDLFVDQLDLGTLGFQRYAAARTGRPGYHPAVLLKLFIYGYLSCASGSALSGLPLPSRASWPSSCMRC
jgi:hypothetical protein